MSNSSYLAVDTRHVLTSIATFHDELITLRRKLHAYPELGFQEHRTARVIADQLHRSGIDEVHTGIAKTGVVGVLKGMHEGKTVCLRADMDALPIQEAGETAHRSTRLGCMHACGHDGHVAMVLGAARYLAAHRDFAGKVIFLFQPGEEGYAGAREMVADGVLDDFSISEIYGLHNWPSLDAGTVAVNAGPMMAARDDFWVRVHGLGGHGAMPQKAVDPVVVSAAIVTALQSIVSRNICPDASAVVTVHSTHAGSPIVFGTPTESVTIPSSSELAGIAKWFDAETGLLIGRRVKEIATHVAAAFGAHAEVDYLAFLPPTINHAGCAARVESVARELLGDTRVSTDVPPSMASEDFSFFQQARPGAYFWLGAGKSVPGLHHPTYDFNDEILPIGAALLAAIAMRALGTDST